MPDPLGPGVRARIENWRGTAILIALTALAPLSIDAFLPSMPEMRREFETSEGTIGLAVMLFLFSFAASQLFYGPASDKFGRRPVLLLGMAVFSAGGLVCLSAQSVEVLLLGRILQGLGGGVGPAVANAIIIDVYRRERAAKVLSAMAIITAFAPMLAPSIGAVLRWAFDWRAVFVFLAGAGAVLFAIVFFRVPETNWQRDPGAIQPGQMTRNYALLWSTPVFAASVLIMAFTFAGQLVFISTSSFVLQEDLGLSAGLYSLGFGAVAVGIFLGALASRRMVGIWPPGRIIATGITLGLVSAVIMALLIATGVRSPLVILVPMFISVGCNGFTRPASAARALTAYPEMAGLASAVMGFSSMAIASGYSIAFGQFIDPSPETMSIAILSSFFVAFLLAVGTMRIRVPVTGVVPVPVPARPPAPDHR